MRSLPRHPSIRLRLTLVYGVVLLATCGGLLGLTYALLYNSLYAQVNVEQRPHGTIVAVTGDKDTDQKLWALQIQRETVARLRREVLLSSAGTSAVVFAVTAVVGLGASWFVAGRTLRPLRTLTATTRRITGDRLHERIALEGPRDELKELADTFDEMIGRLEASFESQRRFVADASHELRTPLAIVRTGAEVLLAKPRSTPEQWAAMAQRTLIATGRAERLLDGLLALARSDRGVLAREAHDLAVSAAAAVADADGDAERAGLTVTSDLRPAPALGDPVLFDRLLSNLVDNAIRHNRPGGTVDVATGLDAAGRAVVTVHNSGDDVPAADVERLFEPFQRLGDARTDAATGLRPTGSTGLGLAIVRSIVRAHGGAVTAAPNEGGGLSVTVTLPPPAAGAVPQDPSQAATDTG